MKARIHGIGELFRFVQSHLLALIALSYALATVFPAWGLWMKHVRILEAVLPGGRVEVTLPSFLLSFLLLAAGLRVRVERIRQILRRPAFMLVGLVANALIPLGYVLMLIFILKSWHNADEAATILVGLALVAAMPVAGSSTGWAQTANGDMALSLGLVLASTVLSPLTTPMALNLVGRASPGGYAAELHRMAGAETGSFLLVSVLVPSLLGIAVRTIIPAKWVVAVERGVKVPSTCALLALCYINASACLPDALGYPDWDFLAITLGIVVGLCVLTFAAGYLLSRWLGADPGQRASLMFGLGMNNNGTGLVLASVALASRPLAMLPIIAYNLVQHLIAGYVHAMLRNTEPA